MNLGEYDGHKLEPNELAFPEGTMLDYLGDGKNLVYMPDGTIWRLDMISEPKSEFVSFDELLKNAGLTKE